MHKTTSDAVVSLNNQQKTDARGLGFQTELQTPSGCDGPEQQRQLGTFLAVWGPPLKKAVGGAVLLAFVAYLGHVSDRLESYGPVRALDQRVVALLGGSPEAESARGEPAPLAEVQAGAPDASASATESQPSLMVQADAVTPPPGCPKAADPGASARLSDGRIVLNEASVAELDSLPGIGAARAQAIVALRDKLKGFKKLSDLLRIRGIGHKSFLKLKEQLVLDRPSSTPPTEPHTAPEPNPQKPPVDQPAPSAPTAKDDSQDQVAAARIFAAPRVAAMMALGEPAPPAQ